MVNVALKKLVDPSWTSEPGQLRQFDVIQQPPVKEVIFMSKTYATVGCELCLATCEDGVEYGLGFSQIGPDEQQDVDHKRVCRQCFGAVKLFAYQRLFAEHKSKLDQASQRLMAHSVEG